MMLYNKDSILPKVNGDLCVAPVVAQELHFCHVSGGNAVHLVSRISSCMMCACHHMRSDLAEVLELPSTLSPRSWLDSQCYGRSRNYPRRLEPYFPTVSRNGAPCSSRLGLLDFWRDLKCSTTLHPENIPVHKFSSIQEHFIHSFRFTCEGEAMS